MNWFVLINGVVYVCAGVYSLWYGHALWALVWWFYGGSAFIMAFLESQSK